MATTWKHAERAIAKRLGCTRHPVNGRGDEPDLSNTWLAVEAKHRAHLPDWLHSAMGQAERNAGERLPVVILHQAGQRYDQSYVVMRLEDFAEWHCAQPLETQTPVGDATHAVQRQE